MTRNHLVLVTKDEAASRQTPPYLSEDSYPINRWPVIRKGVALYRVQLCDKRLVVLKLRTTGDLEKRRLAALARVLNRLAIHVSRVYLMQDEFDADPLVFEIKRGTCYVAEPGSDCDLRVVLELKEEIEGAAPRHQCNQVEFDFREPDATLDEVMNRYLND